MTSSPTVTDRVPKTLPLLRERWFSTLFFTELAERFGFFGLQAVLVIFVAQPLARGGLGLPAATAAALAGTWISVTYLLGGPGGWLADRVLGVRRTLLLGGVVTAIGHFTMAVPTTVTSGIGLLLVSAGAGLYRPNHQAMCNMLFGSESTRRESGISMLYVGVQLSALLAPLLVGLVGDRYGWHLGFLCGGVMMLLGLIVLRRGTRFFGGVGEDIARPLRGRETRRAVRIGVICGLLAIALVGLGSAGLLPVFAVISLLGLVTLVAPIVAYVLLYRDRGLTGADKTKLRSFLWVVVGWTLFFMMISQGGSVMLLFAQNSTDRNLFGFSVPASWFESVSPFCILILAPVFAWLLPRMGGGTGALPRKFTIALLLSGGSFVVMAGGALLASGGHLVSPLWLVLAYFMLSCAELIVLAAGTAAASDVVPKAYISQTIGVLGLFAAFGGGVGSQIVLIAQVLPADGYYLAFGLVVCVVGVVMLVRRRAISRGLAGTPQLSIEDNT